MAGGLPGRVAMAGRLPGRVIMFLMKGFIDPRTHAVTGPASNGTQAGGVAGQLVGGGGGDKQRWIA